MASVPDEKLTWTPHPRSRSLGALASHIAAITFWSAHILDRDAFDLDTADSAAANTDLGEAASAAAVLARFGEGTVVARRLLHRSDGELAALWSLRQGGQALFCMPRAAAFRTFVLGHVVHHRGQLSVYLRLNDIPVPPIYGPSADSRRT